MKILKSLASLALLGIGISADAQMSLSKNNKEHHTVTANVVKLLTGHFTNQEQADTTTIPILKYQEFIAERFWKQQKPDEYWIYQCWLGNDPSNALAERLIKLTFSNTDTCGVELYMLPVEYRNRNLWIDRHVLDDLSERDLIFNCKAQGYWSAGRDFRIVSKDHCTSQNQLAYDNVTFDYTFTHKKMVMRHNFWNGLDKLVFTYPATGNVFERK